MSFKLNEGIKELLEDRQKKEYEEQYFTYKGSKVHVTDFEERSITTEMQEDMLMSGSARDVLPTKLTDEALILTAKQYKSQCREFVQCVTYEDGLLYTILPELIKRLEEKIESDKK